MNAWITALAILLCAVLSFWLLRNLEEADVVAERRVRHEPDYYVDHMVRRTTGVNGELRNVLRASHVEHFPDDDTTELASPHLEIYNGAAEPWHVIAERGWISAGNDVVLLHGEVEIWRYGADGERAYQVLTTELRVLPKEQYAETDNPTIIVSPAAVAHAIGMRANFAHDRVELINRVRSRYEGKPPG
ncbi:MAG: LPS export ABC transporter periplasmic protein LptC [Gammaproteobacteria bacterium]|nr:LPS export ABC transporter periplasmic protein LptC [Gammaproteobacteria bacterium]MCP5200651.1 LPS export ABC transporter periplasmic protein LptC [Gammaproteobacteria bacterium]